MSAADTSKESGGLNPTLAKRVSPKAGTSLPQATLAARRRSRRRSRITLAVCALALVGIGLVALRAVARDRGASIADAQATTTEVPTTRAVEEESVIEVVDLDDYEEEDTLRIEIPLDPASPSTEELPPSPSEVNGDLDPLQLIVANGQMTMIGTARSEQEAQEMVDQASDIFGSSDIIRDFTIDATAPEPSRGVVVRKPVAFASGSAVIRDEFKPILDACADVMVHNPRLVMTISGHTDATGDSEFNLALAEQRAQAVVDYYTEQGIESDKFDTLAVGESMPTADNSSAEGREANRRADLEFEDVFDEVVEATDVDGSDR